MLHPEFPVVSFLSIPLLLCSLPSHIRAGSVCTIALMSWLVVMSIIRGVNSLVWADNFVVRLEVWCDITTKILIGFTYAVPASALCILRHLENVASTRSVMTTKADKRRRQIFEAAMCFGVPLFFMALHYVVQGHRFDLIEDFGCYPSVYVSVAGLCIVYLPPIAMSLVTFVYAAMALHHFLRRRIEFAAHLQNSQSFITPGRYFRLMALAIVEMGWDTGVNAYIIYFNVNLTGLRPWISWENVHSNFSRVGVFPEFLMPSEVITQLTWQWWIVPISCFCFFIFFAFGEEAMSDYRAFINWFRRIILRRNIAKSGFYGTASMLPTHRRPRPPNVDITLPLSSDNASEHGSKAWDELSLKMPEIMDHMALPSTDPRSRLSIVSEDNSSFSLDDSECSQSMHTSEESSFNAVEQSSSPLPINYQNSQDLRIPALTVTCPESEVSSPDNMAAVTLPTTSTPRPPNALHRTPSPILSRPTSYRHSTSTDLDISVSPAYLPDEHTLSRHHEETSINQDTSGGALISRPGPAYSHPHGGVRMMVEKTVV